MGLARRSLEKLSEIMEIAQGLRVASPMPTLMRAMNIWKKFFTRPQAMVAADQIVMPAATIQVRRRRSASQPRGRPMVA